MAAPRKATFGECLYYDIENDPYLNEIYTALLNNYSLKLFNLRVQAYSFNLIDAIKFADLLSKSTGLSNSEKHRLWGQEIAILLNLLYPENQLVNYCLGSVLSAVGNYRGLKSEQIQDYKSQDILDCLYYEYDKSNLQIPGKNDEYFFHSQKEVFDDLSENFYSYSGPTSMGKSFVAQTYIIQQIELGIKQNYAILVPTKALINEVRSNLIESLQDKLRDTNYRIVTAAGDIVLKQKHNFIFVMTPERMLHMLIEMPQKINIDFLFVDEAHKISERGGRAIYYWKVVAQLNKQSKLPSIIFASPNIPNPEIYLKLIPGIEKHEIRQFSSKYTPVCQFKYLVDLQQHMLFAHDDYGKKLHQISNLPNGMNLADVIACVGVNKQNLIYCNSRQKVMEYAVNYAKSLPYLDNPKLESLALEINSEVHAECYLVDLIKKGIAYHVGYLPANIRLRIEKAFEEGVIRTIFCTSTLVEGVNLPADNLFITSYKNGKSTMNEVEFRNLIGRVGRIKYNLYGNIFIVNTDENQKLDKYVELLQNDVPKQVLSLEKKEIASLMDKVTNDLANGDIELKDVRESGATEKDYDAIRKLSLILTRDLATDTDTPIKKAFEPYLSEDAIKEIKNNFPVEKTSDDITLSNDQQEALRKYVAGGKEYPKLTGEKDDVDFEEVVSFLMDLRKIFKWDIYEKQTIGKEGKDKKDAVIRWYAVILLRWIRGNGLSSIINNAIRYKEKHPEEGVWVGRNKISEYYHRENKMQTNGIIAETMWVIENVLLFSISNYFRKFSIEYKALNNVDHFDNDWYEYVEYGTTNRLTIQLQQSGFSREASTYIMRHDNRIKYLIEEESDLKIRKSILMCGNIGVETEAADIQYNMPELFI